MHSPSPFHPDANKIVCTKGYNIASVNSHATTDGRANRALFVAAPELLEELKTIYPTIADNAQRERVGNLIARAMGF